MRFRRFEIAGESMRPTLAPGDFVLGDSHSPVRPEDIVAFEHPKSRNFWLVKRVFSLDGVVDLDVGTVNGLVCNDAFRDELTDRGRFQVPSGSMFVLSDNRNSTVADSRTFGPISMADAYRIRLRYWPISDLRRF